MVEMEKQVLKVYGPYISKIDGRKRVLLYFNDKSRTTKSLARFLYEQKHGKLPAHLTVDHIDEDFINDDLDNLQPLTREENIKKAWENGTNAAKEWFKGFCPQCGVEFVKPMNHVRHNRKQGKPGPYCSKSCAGKFNQTKQKTFRKSKPIILTKPPINC